jgi:hypothetical protein
MEYNLIGLLWSGSRALDDEILSKFSFGPLNDDETLSNL